MSRRCGPVAESERRSLHLTQILRFTSVFVINFLSRIVGGEIVAPTTYSAFANNLINSVDEAQSIRITDVSAMCTANAITGQFMFNSPFAGKIYSARYANVHDCVYYNHYGESMIMFTIPNYKCGTVVQKSTANVISRIENEVYVQLDKETQTVGDRRFLFICDRPDSVPSNFPSPAPTYFQTPVTYFRGTLQPGQTIIVQTIEPTRISVTDGLPNLPGQPGVTNAPQPYVWMQIEDGAGPGKPPVQRPLQLGELVTLVVTGKTLSGGNQYDMFVHSCFASDGGGQDKIQLTDTAGCTAKSTVAGKMMRTKSVGEITYYLPVKAFKFPNSDDVYFSCAVDVCTNCNFPELCSAGAANVTVNNRTRRKSPAVTLLRYERNGESIQVHDYVRILDTGEVQSYRSENLQIRNDPSSLSAGCFDRVTLVVLLSMLVTLLIALICVSTYAIHLLRQRKRV